MASAPQPLIPDPLERQSLGPLLAGLTLLVLAALALAVWDELETRRPWKDYQRRFARAAVADLDREIAAETDRLAAYRAGPEGSRLAAALAGAAAAAAPGTPLAGELAAATAEVERLRNRLQEQQDLVRRLNGEKLFLESRRREAARPRIAGLAAELDRLDREQGRTTAELEKARARLSRLEAPWRRAREAEAAPAARLEALARARTRLAAGGTRVEQLLPPATTAAERCLSCHTAMAPLHPDLGKQPWRGHPGDHLVHHPPERFGCVACHGGYGTALDGVAAPHGFDPSLPRELRRGVMAQGSCAACHRFAAGRPRALFAAELPGAEVLARGMRAFERNLCHGCHATPGFPDRAVLASSLDQVPAKLAYSDTVNWIKDPAGESARPRMPRFFLEPGEAEALAAWIFSLPAPASPRPAWDELATRPEAELSEEELARVDERVEAGSRIWARVQCGACHPRGSRGGQIPVDAPDLGRAGRRLARDWLHARLTDPVRQFPEGRMPAIRLSEVDVRHLVEYLLRDPEFGGGDRPPASPPPPAPEAAARGRELARRHGCSGCHAFPGAEGDPPTGNPLDDYGDKDASRMDFGLDRETPRTLEAWTRRKLVAPKAFGPDLAMPVPHLSPPESRAVTAFLLGLSRRPVPEEWRAPAPALLEAPGEAGRILARRRCLTCHSLAGRGGDYAPELGHQGSRTPRSWLVPFLREPASIRPRLVQMPQLFLPEEEIEALAGFLEVACRRDAWEALPGGAAGLPEGAELERQARELMAGHACLACHSWEGKGGVLGPDIQEIGSRLRPGFLAGWLLDPRRLDRDSLAPRHGLEPHEATLLAAFLANRRKP